MKTFSTFAVVFGLLASTSAVAHIERGEPAFDKAGLVNVIEGDKNIIDLEHLVPQLPGAFRINFTLKHGVKRTGERGHLIEDKVSQSADPLAPRAILWDERTGFSLSYNGGLATQTANNRLDILSFDKNTKTFTLEDIDFPIQPGHPNISKGNDCTTCHGADSRPIFAMYPDWPSFYGSDNDELTRGNIVQAKELMDYKKFRTTLQNARYLPLFDQLNIRKYLKLDPYPSFPYRQNTSEVPTDISRAFAFRPSLRLGIVYNRMTAQMISQKIITHKNYSAFNRLFAFNMLECQWPSKAETKRISYMSKVQALLGQKPIIRSNKTLDYRQNLALFDLKINDIDIRYSYNHQGYANTDATKKIMEVGYIGNYFNSYFDGSATIDELLTSILVKNMSAQYPKLNVAGFHRGLSVKYSRFVERYKYDKEYFDEMDKWGLWIAIPYAKEVAAQQHRESFSSDMSAMHQKACLELENAM